MDAHTSFFFANPMSEKENQYKEMNPAYKLFRMQIHHLSYPLTYVLENLTSEFKENTLHINARLKIVQKQMSLVFYTNCLK